MAVHVQVEDDAVEITFTGIDAVLALKQSLTLPIAEIESARVDSVRELVKSLGIRVGGGYWPKLMATGHFTYRGRRGERQLWSVYRDTEALVIETRRPKPRRIVLQHPDRERLAWLIAERVTPH